MKRSGKKPLPLIAAISNRLPDLYKRAWRKEHWLKGDAQTAAWLVMAMVSGIILQSQLDPQAANWEKVGRQGLQVMLEGLRKRDA